MKAMILAAGRGKRMGHLTENTAKPLLKIGGKALIEYHIERLVKAGFNEIVINRSRHSEQFDQLLGDGSAYNARIVYSDEGDEPLNTGGGIFKALPQLSDTSFLVINGDVWCDFPLEDLPKEPEGLVHLVMVPNPPHHPEGDFALIEQRIRLEGETRATFSGIAMYRPELFSECSEGEFPLAPVLRYAIAEGQVAGELHEGQWMDVGTPERLSELEELLENR